ncbi:MAG: MoxR family ATPase [Defluviitaleaceae bacterium]|nr:MoxR family ATPase [Defluviitaleaceae bacterium]
MMVEKGYTHSLITAVKNEMQKAIINQDEITTLALTAMLSSGHVLIEGVPGLAKTLWVRTLAKIINTDFKRVSFTPDLMPSDILGTKIFSQKVSDFVMKKGPLFTNLFLADEINRTPPKTQSALLEVMAERAITIDGENNELSEPFVVFATQNPVEYEGTYPLPEALVDRFMMKLYMDYPGVAAEKTLLNMYHNGFDSQDLSTTSVRTICTAEQFLRCREEIRNITVDESILNYIVSIIETTRRVNAVSIGASPRGSVALLLAAKSYAAINGRDFCIPDDIKDLAPHILRHRIILKPEAEIDGLKTDKVIENILAQVKVPR